MEALGAPRSPPPATAATSAILDDDDLLGEILLHVAFPTSLVRTALVCKSWLRLASDPVFLRRFRDLHPPSFLGFYVKTGGTKPPRFVPMPQPPELAAVVHRANFDLGTLGSDSFGFCVDCCNGLLLLTSYLHDGPPVRTVRCPLYPGRYTTILPPVPQTSSIHDDRFTYYDREVILKGGDDGLAADNCGCVIVYVLQDDIWAIYSSVATEFTRISLRLDHVASLIGDGKIYTLAYVSGINILIVLDLVSASLSLVNLPEEDLQIRIWLHGVDGNNGAANWFLVNTICLREICANHMIPSHGFKDADVHAPGSNSEFVFIEVDNALYLFYIKSKVLKKVYDVTEEDDYVFSVSPFMMVWPPKFPLMKEGRDLLKE
ncbi:hypothetical protein VPH35_125843 [Triticum aestivum]